MIGRIEHDALGRYQEYDDAVRNLNETVRSLGLVLSHRPADETEPDENMAAETRAWLESLDPGESVLLVRGEAVFCTPEGIRESVSRHTATGGLVVGVRQPLDHPCTLSSHHEIVAGGFIEPDTAGYSGHVDDRQPPLLGVRLNDHGTAHCVWNQPHSPQDGLLVNVFFMTGDGRETHVGPLRFNQTSRELAEGLGTHAVSIFVVTRRVDDGPSDLSIQYMPEGCNWAVSYGPRRMINLGTGKTIHGRQAYPDVFRIEPGLMVGRAADLLRAGEQLRERRAAGVPVTIDIPVSHQARTLAEAAPDHVQTRKPLSPVRPCPRHLADMAARSVEAMRPEGYHSYRFSTALTAIAAYRRKAANAAGPQGRPRVTMSIVDRVSPGLPGELRSLEAFGNGDLAVSDAPGNLALVRGGTVLTTMAPGVMQPGHLFGDGDTVMVCDTAGRAVWTLAPDLSASALLRLDDLGDEARPFVPLRGSLADGWCVLVLRHKTTKWSTLARFRPNDPKGTWAMIDTANLLFPALVTGGEGGCFLIEHTPLGIWHCDQGMAPTRLAYRDLLPDGVVAATQGDAHSILTFRNHFMAVAPDLSWTDPLVPASALDKTGRAVHTPDATARMAPDGTLRVVDSCSGTILTVQTTPL
ncbi:MAG: hypothetical protein ABIK45_04435 [Pseudomonadota bacterium]